MATVVSFINMKGGVGKTTLASQIALAAGFGRHSRVLAIDLDPQSNLSQSLMGAQRYKQHLRENSPTVVQIFDGFRPPSGSRPGPRRVRVNETILKKVCVRNPFSPDLIPSRLELTRNLKNGKGMERKLAEALAQIEDQYDLIIIDCPPTESVLTDAAYAASRYVMVPVKPEFLGAIGLPLLASSMNDFRSRNPDHELDICGIAINFFPNGKKFGPEARTSIAEIEEIAKEHRWSIYPARIPVSPTFARATRAGTFIATTTSVKAPTPQKFHEFAKQFFASIGMG